tara:strand:+ start:100 stop:828 length:729 start_codon:yes stop_codon:yes gene_type:complete
MPTAISFTALGRGNGFGKGCLSSIDTSFYDHVEPLTLSQAMNFYWLFYRLEHSASASRSGSSVSDGSASSSFVEPVFGSEGKYNDPYKRVCTTFGSFNGSLDASGRALCSSQMSVSVERLYNGDATDEDNFIGYGIRNISVDADLTRLGQCSAGYSIASYMNGTNFSGSGTVRTYGTTEIEIGDDTIPVVFEAKASGIDLGSGISVSASASGASASTSQNSPGTISESASVNGFKISKYTIT